MPYIIWIGCVSNDKTRTVGKITPTEAEKGGEITFLFMYNALTYWLPTNIIL